MAWRIAAVAVGLVILVAYVALSGRWVSTGDSWYLDLDKPWWQPPPVVFGLIWPYNFVVLGVVAVAVGLGGRPGVSAAFLVCLAASVALAVAWAWLFYVPHHLLGAALALTGAAIITVGVLAAAFTTAAWLGWILVPYQVWLILAASLSWGYTWLEVQR